MKKNQAIIEMWVLLLTVGAFLSGPTGAGIACAGDELTLPQPVHMVQPVYPEQERIAGIEGTVLLAVKVKSDGTIGSVKTEQEVKDHPAFTSSATAAVKQWRFEPAQQGGRAVVCSVIIPVRFVLEEKKRPAK